MQLTNLLANLTLLVTNKMVIGQSSSSREENVPFQLFLFQFVTQSHKLGKSLPATWVEKSRPELETINK